MRYHIPHQFFDQIIQILLWQNVEDDGDADSEDNCIVGREEREAYLAERKVKTSDYNRAYYTSNDLRLLKSVRQNKLLWIRKSSLQELKGDVTLIVPTKTIQTLLQNVD